MPITPILFSSSTNPFISKFKNQNVSPKKKKKKSNTLLVQIQNVSPYQNTSNFPPISHCPIPKFSLQNPAKLGFLSIPKFHTPPQLQIQTFTFHFLLSLTIHSLSQTKMAQTAPPNNPYQPMLTESIQRFLTEYRNGVTDFSNFGSIFSRLLQIVPDPPLQILWFYSALTFHTSKLTHHRLLSPISKRVVLVKELFQLLTARSSPCGQFKKIATLAPVIYELYHLAVQHDKKISRKEIENLLEGVVSYTSICCGGGDCEVVGVKDEEESLTVSGFSDVLGVWTVDNCGDRDELRVFFPVVSEEVRNGIRVGCGVGYLAGVVMCEAFLLRLCLKFGSGNSRLELEKDLHNWAIQTINGFRSFWFFGESC